MVLDVVPIERAHLDAPCILDDVSVDDPDLRTPLILDGIHNEFADAESGCRCEVAAVEFVFRHSTKIRARHQGCRARLCGTVLRRGDTDAVASDSAVDSPMLRSLAILVLTLASIVSVSAADSCGTCTFPCARAGDGSFTVRLTGGRTDPNRVFTHVVRDTFRVGLELVQAFRFSSKEAGVCSDTVVLADHAQTLVMGLTLGKSPPLYVPIFPVAEYVVSTEPHVPTSFLEVGGFLGYGGSDGSVAPQVGFNSFYYGAEALVAPFGAMLGRNLSLALGGGILLEGGRLRFPVLGHVRYSFAGMQDRTSARYVPDACAFSCAPGTDTIAAPEGAVRRPGPDSVDRAAILVHERVINRDEHAPYLFIEGGPVFNGSFEGAGPDPSINRDDYGQWVAGGGAGIAITTWLHAQLAYRYARLNLRTPCVQCGNVYQVNTNEVHSVLLRVALHWGW